jgi:uridine monophosphate synthetase
MQVDHKMTAQEILALELHRIGALKFGEFTLKSGLQSPFYVDMRLLVSAPDVLQLAAEALADATAALNYERIAAIPYAALPIGVALSLHLSKPLIYTRKERKEYGTGALIEGKFQPGEHILLVDDVITRGDSKIEVMKPLQDAGLIITDVAVLLDRQSGGAAMLATHGYRPAYG